MRRYQLENRYQDEQWEKINEGYDDLSDALKIAYAKTGDPIAYGMVRVIDTKTNKVMAEYSAGAGRKDLWSQHKQAEVISGPNPLHATVRQQIYVDAAALEPEEEIVGYLLAYVEEGSSQYSFDCIFCLGARTRVLARANIGSGEEGYYYECESDFEYATLTLKLMIQGHIKKNGKRVLDGYIKPIRARRNYEQVAKK